MPKKKTEKHIQQTLPEPSPIQKVVNYYFETKGYSLEQIKEDAKKKKILYSRFTKPAKQLIDLAGSPNEAVEAIKKVADWAKSRNLDYSIETVFKKWLELDKLKPKEIIKKPFYNNDPMVWSDAKKKWYVVSSDGTWLEYCDKEELIEWREEKKKSQQI